MSPEDEESALDPRSGERSSDRPDDGGSRLPDAEVDARFADIVAHLGDPDEQHPEPAADAQARAGEPSPDPGPGDAAGPPRPPSESLILSIPVWRGPTAPPPDELEEALDAEGYTPGPVDLPPGEDMHYWGAVLGLVLGPLVILWVAFAHPFYATWWLLAGLGMVVGGFALLVLRGPAERDPDDDDDGARV